MFENQEINKAHGSPYDRGAADSWYGRPRFPHWYPEGTYNGDVIEWNKMSEFEIYSYHKGFDENEADPSARKQWQTRETLEGGAYRGTLSYLSIKRTGELWNWQQGHGISRVYSPILFSYQISWAKKVGQKMIPKKYA